MIQDIQYNVAEEKNSAHELENDFFRGGDANQVESEISLS